MKKIDLLFHPIRTRIIQQLILNRGMTTKELREQLSDVPQATLYRHVKLLFEAEIIRIAETNKVTRKGEHVYEVALDKLRALKNGIGENVPEDQVQYVAVFLSTLLEQATFYLNETPPDQYQQDGFNYWYALMYLNDQEFKEVINSINSVVAKALEKKKTPERKLRGYAYMFIPRSGKES